MQPHQRARIYKKWIFALANAARAGLSPRRKRYWNNIVVKLTVKLIRP